MHQEAYKTWASITDTVKEMEQQLEILLQHQRTAKIGKRAGTIEASPRKEALEEAV